MWTILITDLRVDIKADERILCFGHFVDEEVAKNSANEKRREAPEDLHYDVIPIYFSDE